MLQRRLAHQRKEIINVAPIVHVLKLGWVFLSHFFLFSFGSFLLDMTAELEGGGLRHTTCVAQSAADVAPQVGQQQCRVSAPGGPLSGRMGATECLVSRDT